MNGFHTFAKQLHLLQENASKYDWIDLNVWDSSDIVFSVEGPVGTPYEGGIYRVRFDNFISVIFNCLKIEKDSMKDW